MRINCLHPNCELCKVEQNCMLKQPCNSKILELEKEIEYELSELKQIRKALSNAISSKEYYTPPSSVLIQMEHDTMEIIRELRHELKGELNELQSNRKRIS